MRFFTRPARRQLAALAVGSLVASGVSAATLTAAEAATPAFTTVRLVAGPAVVEANGTAWASDSLAVGGRIYDSGHAITNATTSQLYSRERVGLSGYAIPVSSPGTYRITLREAELWYDAAGKRVFDVKAEGVTRIANLDIFAAAGGKFRAHKRIFDAAVTDGTLNLDFVAKVGDAKVGSLQVERVTATPTPTPPSPTATPTPTPTATPTPATEAALKYRWGTPVVTENMNELTGFGKAYAAESDWGRKTRANVSATNGFLNIVGKSDGTTGGIGHKFSQKYGRWETRMQVGGTEGCWRPVLILWRDSGTTAEIDYAESKGLWSGTRFFLHHGGGQTTANVSFDATKWVNYAVEWTPTAIRGYVDGKQFFEDTNTSHFPSVTMHQTFQLDAQKRTGTCTSNAWMKVDWLKIYK